ncbi:vacuolar protein sorting-associated protein vps17 [Cryptococcus deuterogattii 99/473]|uniref:Vacuolar protein sorting-associated protein vps17 n=1 Tax=Cryptococcus deuterogattii Ram5 TaxID=1296110 RepID=A0A0D0V6N9_9TREE|nr:vacuolar protein sorting-associated protein vps17 [Cryptococcus deuterogattii Ram5]KIY59679.1 vacuolar protein sorting-associated protein vps17 [Cryptococcus deuterogattii 99/473]
MDPLSPTDDINAGWSSPTTSLRFNPPSAAEDTPPASATSNPYSDRNATASENANGFGTYTSQGLGSGAVGGDVGAGYREPVVFGAPGMGLVSPPPESQSQQETAGGAAQQERNAPRVYLRVRIGTLERNKKDLLVRFDASYSPIPPPTSKRTQTNVLSALTKVVRRGPLDEDDELSSAKIALDKLEERYGHAATCVSHVGKARRQLANSNAELGAKMVSLSTVESEPSLAGAERKIGRAWEQVSGMINAQADSLEQSLSHRVNAISQNLHVSLRAHSRHAHEDIAVSLMEAARMSAMYHKQALRELESLRADISKVAPGAAPLDGLAVSGKSPAASRVQPTQSPFMSRAPPPPQPQFASPYAVQPPLTAQVGRQPPMARTPQPQIQPQPQAQPQIRPPVQPQTQTMFQSQPQAYPRNPYATQPPPPPPPPQSAAPSFPSQSRSNSYVIQPPGSSSQSPYGPAPNAAGPSTSSQFSPRIPTSPPTTGFPVSDGTQSMFLPSGGNGGMQQRPHSAAPDVPGFAGASRAVDPLAGFPSRPAAVAPGMQGMQGMAQSMFIPSQPQSQPQPQLQSQTSFRPYPGYYASQAQPLSPNAGPGPSNHVYQSSPLPFQPPQPPYHPGQGQFGQGYPVQNVQGYPGTQQQQQQQQPQQASPFPGPAGVQRAATIATERRKLDERKAAKMLAGGF